MRKRGLRVLVVGDEVEFATTLVQPFRAAGHEVEAAPDGPSALAAARAALPDVVFLGMPLSRGDGYAVARRLHGLSTWKRPMLVALTEQGDPESCRRSREAGIDLFLVKPVVADKLQGFLRRFQNFVQDIEDFDPVI